MGRMTQTTDRRTRVDEIVDFLEGEISSMRLLPGSRISETEIATRFGVSRQPVRDAFTRLQSMDLIRVRPKKATEVRKLSIAAIEKARFIRAAVEAAVLRQAAQRCDLAGGFQMDSCLALQRQAQAEGDHKRFAELDYEFHRTLCEIAGVPFAFDVIREEKAKVDRLCMLGLSKEDRMPQLIEDHESIAEAIKAGHAEDAAAAGMRHLSRLDATIETIRQTSAAYFEPE